MLEQFHEAKRVCVYFLLYPYFSHTYADGAECVYDGQELFFIFLYFSNTYMDGAEG